jgi:hypothetical protein
MFSSRGRAFSDEREVEAEGEEDRGGRGGGSSGLPVGGYFNTCIVGFAMRKFRDDLIERAQTAEMTLAELDRSQVSRPTILLLT